MKMIYLPLAFLAKEETDQEIAEVEVLLEAEVEVLTEMEMNQEKEIEKEVLIDTYPEDKSEKRDRKRSPDKFSSDRKKP